MGYTDIIEGHHTVLASKIYPSMQWARKLRRETDNYRQKLSQL